MSIRRPLLREPMVKICGIRDRAAADVAVSAGASALGVMLAPSRRQVSPEIARDLVNDPRISVVGVVVNETAESLSDLIERSGIDLIQLSGDEPSDLLDHLAIPVIKAIRLQPGQSVNDAERTIARWLDHRHPVDAILLDAHVAGHYGGTGRRVDWTIAAELAERYPVILAGGLTPENVSDGIRQVAPFGVDVSSGVETNGTKDHQKIREFVAAAHAATRSVTRS